MIEFQHFGQLHVRNLVQHRQYIAEVEDIVEVEDVEDVEDIIDVEDVEDIIDVEDIQIEDLGDLNIHDLYGLLNDGDNASVFDSKFQNIKAGLRRFRYFIAVMFFRNRNLILPHNEEIKPVQNSAWNIFLTLNDLSSYESLVGEMLRTSETILRNDAYNDIISLEFEAYVHDYLYDLNSELANN